MGKYHFQKGVGGGGALLVEGKEGSCVCVCRGGVNMHDEKEMVSSKRKLLRTQNMAINN